MCSRVIWLGDLNYRIALSYAEAKKLVDAGDWAALFEKDQLKTEREGGVFRGWSEAVISFAPTYKYSWNSDSYYVGEDDDGAASKKKAQATDAAMVLLYGWGEMLLVVGSRLSFRNGRR